jgi:hypothetical protein
LDAILQTIAATEVAEALRRGRWLYPLVNAGHVLGIALLVGAVVPLDLRRLGAWAGVPAAGLERVLTQVAASGLGLAVVTGALLFAVGAPDYADLRVFQAKMALVAAGLANALWARARLRAGRSLAPFALASAAIWLTVLLLGRLIGYQM